MTIGGTLHNGLLATVFSATNVVIGTSNVQAAGEFDNAGSLQAHEDITFQGGVTGNFINGAGVNTADSSNITANADVIIGGPIGGNFENTGSLSGGQNVTVGSAVGGDFFNGGSLTADGGTLTISAPITGDFTNVGDGSTGTSDGHISGGGAFIIDGSIGGDFDNAGHMDAGLANGSQGDLTISAPVTGAFDIPAKCLPRSP